MRMASPDGYIVHSSVQTPANIWMDMQMPLSIFQSAGLESLEIINGSTLRQNIRPVLKERKKERKEPAAEDNLNNCFWDETGI